MTSPSASAHIDIDAPAEAVYAIVSDPKGLATISSETTKVLHRRKDAGRAGSYFVGLNSNGWRRWPTISRTTDAEPGRRFAFDVNEVGIPVSRWEYAIEPTDSGCRVVESTWDRRPGWFAPITVPFTGVSDRVTTNTRNIEATLQRLKEHAERG